MKLVSLYEARINKLKFYYTGKPCKNGHFSKRQTSNSHCCQCNIEHRLSNIERYKIVWADSHAKNADKQKQRDIDRWKYNKSHEQLRAKKYRKENKEKIKTKHREHRLNNLDQYRFASSLNRAKKKKATPKWANLDKIKETYKNCPINKQVDHIIPLQGKTVCGLHVEGNLQYLTKTQNLRKGNKLLKRYRNEITTVRNT